MKVNLVVFASRTHPEEVWKKDMELYLRELREAGVEFNEKLVSSWTDAVSLKLIKALGGTVAIFLTGGTSKIAVRALESSVRPLIFTSSPRHNALPSALEAAALLRRKFKAHIVLSEACWAEKVKVFLGEAGALGEEGGVKVLSFGGLSFKVGLEEASPEVLKDKFNITVEGVPYDELYDELLKVKEEDVEKVVARLKLLNLTGSLELDRPARLYLAVDRLVKSRGADGFTFNCFNLMDKLGCTPCLATSLLADKNYLTICEGEAQSIAAGFIAHRMLKTKFFMANVSSYTDRSLILAHCTAPTSICEGKVGLLPHFETSLPVSLDVELRRGEVTMFNLSKLLDEILAFRGYVKSSSLGKEGLCRTQAEVVVEDPEGVVNQLSGGHVLLVYGNFMEKLSRLAKLLNLNFKQVTGCRKIGTFPTSSLSSAGFISSAKPRHPSFITLTERLSAEPEPRHILSIFKQAFTCLPKPQAGHACSIGAIFPPHLEHRPEVLYGMR